jgi:hypothetical protein
VLHAPEQARKLAEEAIREAAWSKDNPADLINVALEELVRGRYELPGYTTLDELTARVRAEVKVLNQLHSATCRVAGAIRELGHLGVTQSMGAVGTSADNSLAEAFNATLKRQPLAGATTWPDALSCRRPVSGGSPATTPAGPTPGAVTRPHRRRNPDRSYAPGSRLIKHPACPRSGAKARARVVRLPRDRSSSGCLRFIAFLAGLVHRLQRAWVGDIRAARMAGRSPARAPIARVEASPPAQASGGITVAQCWVWA